MLQLNLLQEYLNPRHYHIIHFLPFFIACISEFDTLHFPFMNPNLSFTFNAMIIDLLHNKYYFQLGEN